MKVPARKATLRATDGPIYAADGGGIGDKKTPKTDNLNLPASWVNRDTTAHPNTHFLAQGEQPLTDDQLLQLGLSRFNPAAENTKATQEGDNGWYKAVPYTPPVNTVIPSTTDMVNQAMPATGIAKALPKYPRVGTPDWEANQAAVLKLREERQTELSGRAEGGYVGKGIQGLLAGGAVGKDDVIKDPNYRKYKSGFVPVVEDIGLTVADLALGSIAPDLIKSEDYQTRGGANEGNATAHAVGQVAGGVATGVLGAINPAWGAAAEGVHGLGSMVDGEDKKIEQGQIDVENSVKGIAKIAGGVAGSKISSNSDTVAPQAKGTGIASVIDSAVPLVQQATAKKDENTAGSDYSNYDTSLFNSAQQSVWSEAKTNEDKAALIKEWGLAEGGPVQSGKGLSKMKMYSKMDTGKAEGGKIVGKGGPKTDSIPAMLDNGGFVVPAENAHLAEQIRTDYLGDFKSKKAKIKNGDTKVMISDGEHYFDAEERAHLESQGIDLNALAPNAKDGEGKAEGGGVDGGEDLIKIGEERLRKKKESQAKEKAKTSEDSSKKDLIEKNASAWSENKVFRREKQNEYRDKLLDIEAQRIDNDKRYKAWIKVIDNPNSTEAQIAGAQFANGKKSRYNSEEEYVTNAKKLKAEADKILKDKSVWDNDKNFDDTTGGIKSGTGNESQLKKAVDPKRVPGMATPTGGTGKGITKVIGDNGPVTSTGSTSSGKGIAKTMEDQKLANKDLQTFTPVTADVNASKVNAEGVASTEEPAKNNTATNTTGTSKTKPEDDVKKGSSIEQMIALTQAGLGLSQLLADGKRPVDMLDPDFEKSVTDAIDESKFGLSDQQRTYASNGIERNRRNGIADIVNLSGGNSGTALANINSANIAADDQMTGLSIQSENLRLNKKKYADSLVAAKAGMKRQLFDDKIGAFEQDQTAGAALLGSGIKNLIGSMRYDKQLAADAEAEKLSTPTFTF